MKDFFRRREITPVSAILFVVLVVISLFWIAPIFFVAVNTFKGSNYVLLDPFKLPIGKYSEAFVGFTNYTKKLNEIHFFEAFKWSLLISVSSIAAIILFTSMTGWFITRMHNKVGNFIYFLFAFSMVVPFQMVMIPLTYVVTRLGLDNPYGLIIVYMGFGAGLSVFMFCGFAKAIPFEIEEAALIDGCNYIKMFFGIVFPILRPTAITVAILNAMWIWNDFLLPYLVLDREKYVTIPIAIQSLKNSYGSIDWGVMMAMIMLTILPLIVLYLGAQKYIIKGIAAGAVKG